MKRGLYKNLFIYLVLVFTMVFPAYSEPGCILTAELVNQDPYPALPGTYVDVLFQLNGIDYNCEEGVSVDLFLEYPFSLDIYELSSRFLESSAYVGLDYNSFWNNVYRIRVDENALEGDYELEFRYKEGTSYSWDNYYLIKPILKVEDARTDFEIHISNYNIGQRDLVFEIINIGNQDVEALVVEILPQNNIIVKGQNRNILGDLDSNEYSSASFEAIPSDGEIKLLLHYTDSINERRVIEKIVYYDSNYFIDSLENIEEENNTKYYVLCAIFVIFFILYLRKRRKTKRRNGGFSI